MNYPHLNCDLTPIADSTANYWYTGICPHTGELLRLPRTPLVEAIARNLMLELAQTSIGDRQGCSPIGDEGKMYGVLLAESKTGEQVTLKAFSGLLNGVANIPGWVPPIPGRQRIATAEAETLEDLAAMKAELIALDRSPARAQYRLCAEDFALRLAQLAIEHRQNKLLRQHQREQFTSTLTDRDLEIALEQLAENSRQDGRERRQLKQERDRILQPLQTILDGIDTRISELKQQRKIRSRQLQAQMHDAYRLMNFLGTSSSLRELMPAGMPTGTGDCCAPKLLHYAASQGLKPIAMAEFWWGGVEIGGKRQGEFYGACQERCQPLMGFMLAGLSSLPSKLTLPIIYEDEYLIAVNKPGGLLSVPGRTIELQDSAIARLRELYPEIYIVHRLDRDTSGILLLARDRFTCRHLSQQFHDRQIHKRYEAILGGIVELPQGAIELPLWGDPLDRPRQQVNFKLGKPSLTKFQILDKTEDYTRIELIPVTGRTHQLRVHTADPQGLGVPILGDRLYACQADVKRLHLHAREVNFLHPHTLARISIQTQCPF